jgi:hypothetical protein
MVDIHEVESGDMHGRWGYILWDRLGPSMHGGYRTLKQMKNLSKKYPKTI